MKVPLKLLFQMGDRRPCVPFPWCYYAYIQFKTSEGSLVNNGSGQTAAVNGFRDWVWLHVVSFLSSLAQFHRYS